MMVRSWMHADPIVVPSELLVCEANRILSESNLHALPVVDDGRLRGLVTRANLLRMGHFVQRTQNADEFNYFITRLKVRDVMVRKPATVQADETMQECLIKGQALGVAQFPVLDQGRVVGVISAREIFQLAAHCLGAWERGSGVTIGPLRLGPGVMGRIAEAAESAGAVLQAIYPALGRHDAQLDNGFAERKVHLRFHAADPLTVAAALEAAGFVVVESFDSQPPALAA